MRRRQFLQAIAAATLTNVATSLIRLPDQQQAIAAKLSLSSDDIYWLVSKPWLRMIAAAEGFPNGGLEAYQTAFTYLKFEGFDDHPRIDIPIPNDPRGRSSDAAGPYQILSTTWDRTRRNHPNIWLKSEPAFSPANQDRAALALSHDTGASAALLAGSKVLHGHLCVSYDAFQKAVYADSREWASLPGHNIGEDSGQNTRTIQWLWTIFQWHFWGQCGYRRAIVPPLPTTEITSHFGMRWGRLHKGIDLAAAVGTPVRSPENATVLRTGSDPVSGLYVVISPEGYLEMEQVYCHLSRVDVEKGDLLKAGDTFSLSGNTGRSTGPHLHIGIWVDGGIIDPYRYLRMSDWFAEET
jgi:murein DD-endopeptidase MepM/ murein hydrolase activator NlpD